MMQPMKQLLFLVALLTSGGCGGHDIGNIDDVVGDSCRSDRDCDTRCYLGDDFPGGFCSLPCSSDRDCPSDTYCMSTNGGVCMFACPEFDCRRLGADWQCRERSRAGGGSVRVCSGD
jgi:hypothetical protein